MFVCFLHKFTYYFKNYYIYMITLSDVSSGCLEISVEDFQGWKTGSTSTAVYLIIYICTLDMYIK